MNTVLAKVLNLLPVSPLLNQHKRLDLDYWLLSGCLALLGLGLVMNASASGAVAIVNELNQYHYFIRHVVYAFFGLGVAAAVLLVPMSYWRRLGWPLLILSFLLLGLVFIPGIGHEANGSKRWIDFGVFKLQSSELAKLFLVLFIAGYIERYKKELQEKSLNFLKPLLIVAGVAVMTLIEPDYGATVVLLVSAAVMVFMANARLKSALMAASVLVAIGFFTIYLEEYRVERLQNLMDPWGDQFGSGYQLTQALIAFGRGEWFGTGLGNSIQKQFYLPEAHTDFVFAVLAEEFGIIGSLLTLSVFVFVCFRAFQIGRWAEHLQLFFIAYFAYGIALLWSIQGFINIGVNLGMLPTKGLTLPFISYGGSSLISCCIGMAILLRIEWEVRQFRLRQQSGVIVSKPKPTSLANKEVIHAR